MNKEKFLAFAGCEDCFTTISLIDFAPPGIMNDFELVYAREQLQRNQDQLVMVQNLIDPKGFLKQIGAFYEATDFNNLVQNNDLGPDEGIGGNEDVYGRGTMRATLMPNGMQMNVLN